MPLSAFLMSYSPFPPCSLQDGNGLCTIHALKPSEGRVSHHSQTHAQAVEIHNAVGKSWNSEEGRAVVDLFWKTLRAETKSA